MTSKSFLPALIIIALSATTYAKDAGFRYINGECVNPSGQKGLNPGFIGQCGDLRNVILGRFDLSDIDLSGSQFTNSDLQQTLFKGANLTGTSFEAALLGGADFSVAKFEKANLTNANMKNTKLIGASFIQSNLSKVNFTGADLSYLNFEGSTFKGTKFKNAKLEETVLKNTDLSEADFEGNNLIGVDLSGSLLSKANFTGAQLMNANFTDVEVESALFTRAQLQGANMKRLRARKSDFRRANLQDADLTDAQIENCDVKGTVFTGVKYARANFRGSMFSAKTLLPFSNDEAKKLGMIFIDLNNLVMILWDEKTPSLDLLKTALTNEGYEVQYSPKVEFEYDGSSLSEFGAVIHLDGTTYASAPSAVAQRALVQYVKDGGKYIGIGWHAYELSQGRYADMRELILLSYIYGGSNSISKKAGMSHPLLEGLPAQFVPQCSISSGNVLNEDKEKMPELLMQDSSDSDRYVLAAKSLGAGLVIDFSISGNYNQGTCLAQKEIQRVILNAMAWTN